MAFQHSLKPCGVPKSRLPLYERLPNSVSVAAVIVLFDRRRPDHKPVYDAMGFAGKPDLGLKRIRLASPPPEKEDWIRQHAREAVKNGQILCFDIEHLPVDLRSATDCQVELSMETLGRMVDQAHDEAPVRVGFYTLMPMRDYWSPVQYRYASDPNADPWWKNNREKFTAQYKFWQNTNSRFRFGRDADGHRIPVGLSKRLGG